MKSRFAKRGTKMALAPLGEPFVELKLKKNCFISEVKPCQTGPKYYPNVLVFLSSSPCQKFCTKKKNKKNIS
jgi:hypothetical protein